MMNQEVHLLNLERTRGRAKRYPKLETRWDTKAA
jgi:hypothetical protein